MRVDKALSELHDIQENLEAYEKAEVKNAITKAITTIQKLTEQANKSTAPNVDLNTVLIILDILVQEHYIDASKEILKKLIK